MKIFLYLAAAILLIGPLLAWGYLVALGCAYVTSSSGCSVGLDDFFDLELLQLAAIPWLVGLVCLIIALRLTLRDRARR